MKHKILLLLSLLLFFSVNVFGDTNVTIIKDGKATKYTSKTNISVIRHGKKVYEVKKGSNAVVTFVKPKPKDKVFVLDSKIINFNYSELAYPTQKVKLLKTSKDKITIPQKRNIRIETLVETSYKHMVKDGLTASFKIMLLLFGTIFIIFILNKVIYELFYIFFTRNNGNEKIKKN